MPLYTSVNNNMTDVMKDAFLMMMCPDPVGFLLTVARFLEFQVVTDGFLLTVALFTGFQIVTVALFTGSRSSLMFASCSLLTGSCRSLEPSSSLLISPALVAALVLMTVKCHRVVL